MLLCHTSDETLKEQSTGPDLGTAVPVLMGMLTKESSGQEIENARAYEGKVVSFEWFYALHRYLRHCL